MDGIVDALDLEEMDDVVLHDGMGLRDLVQLVVEEQWRLPGADVVDTLIAIGGAYGPWIATNVRYRRYVNRMRYDEFCMSNSLEGPGPGEGTLSIVVIGHDGEPQGATLHSDADGPVWAKHWTGSPSQRVTYEWARDQVAIS